MLPVVNAFSEMVWPMLISDRAASSYVHLQYLAKSQWFDLNLIRQNQYKQLAKLCQHATKTVPFYQNQVDHSNWLKKCEHVIAANPNASEPWPSQHVDQLAQLWRELPLLTRRDLQASGQDLFSSQIPKSHYPISQKSTSGSTGAPVTVLSTRVTQLFWQLLTLREHLWHERDFSGSLAAIRYTQDSDANRKQGRRVPNWGLATQDTVSTGPCYQLAITHSIAHQSAWLHEVNPDYLISYPSNIKALLDTYSSPSDLPSQLKELRTFGELCDDSLREQASQLQLKLTDIYSAQEVGYLALQCPHGSYHCQSENALIEILDEFNHPCEPGEVGRVIVTSLNNFASPLIRYDIGDYAQVGEPCACGRGLPAITKIYGRTRNMLILPNGEKRWPSFGSDGKIPEGLPRFSQFQVIQKTREQLMVKVVAPKAFTAEESQNAAGFLQKTLGYEFDIQFDFVSNIERSKTGKYEDFICEVSQ